MAKHSTQASPNDFAEARERLSALGDRVRAAKNTTDLRAMCVELGELANLVIGQVDQGANAPRAEVWPQDLNAPDDPPAWGLDPGGVRRA